MDSLKLLTEDTFSKGLGLNDEYDVRLMVRVENSEPSRVGELLFDDGTLRTALFRVYQLVELYIWLMR